MDVGFCDPLERGEFSVLLRSDKTDCNSGFTCSSCSSYTMDVALDILWQCVIDHMRDVIDIDSSGCYISCYEDFCGFVFELREDRFSLLLEDVSVESLSLISFFDEPSDYIIDIKLGFTKDDSIKIRFHIDDSTKSIEFVLFVDFKVDLRSLRCGHLLVFD